MIFVKTYLLIVTKKIWGLAPNMVLSQFAIFIKECFSSGTVRLRASKIAHKLVCLDERASVFSLACGRAQHLRS